MKKVKFHIETYGETKSVALEDELSVGRTSLAQLVLQDTGLSRLNTTFFRDEDAVFVVDENSLNGTFVNGEKLLNESKRLLDGDEIKIGSGTHIRIEIGEKPPAVGSQTKSQSPKKVQSSKFKFESSKNHNPQPTVHNPQSEKLQLEKSSLLLFAAVGSMLLIIFLALIGYFIMSRYENNQANTKIKSPPKIVVSAAIPIRVVDPLVGEEPDNLDDLLEAWEVQEATLEANDLQAVTASTAAPQLNVSIADWKKQFDKALEGRSAPIGLVSVNVPPEMGGGRGIGKQIAKIKELGYTIDNLPRDFSALAQKRLNGELIELPLATNNYVINVGGSADDSVFHEFEPLSKQSRPFASGMPGFSILSTLAANYDGQKYDLTSGADRKSMKRRLLRMFHPAAKKVLEEIAESYRQKFNRPLLITSLTRSLEYQFALTKVTNNAFRGATPPHTTGCTFDLAYRHMTAEEQNFVMAKIADLESRGILDALREVGSTPCFHVFVYPDGKPPRM